MTSDHTCANLQNQKRKWPALGWGYSSVVEQLPNKGRVLGSIPRTGRAVLCLIKALWCSVL